MMEPTRATFRDFLSFSPNEFGGGDDPLVAEYWLRHIKKELNMLEVNEDKLRITFATFQLVGEADEWWESISREYDVPTMTWATFEELFLGEYFPKFKRDILRDEFIHIEQHEDETVWEFAARFDTLSRYGPEVVATEAEKCEKFRRSLKLSIRSELVPLYIKNFLRMRDAALTVEQVHAESQGQNVYWQCESKGKKRVGETSVWASIHKRERNQ